MTHAIDTKVVVPETQATAYAEIQSTDDDGGKAVVRCIQSLYAWKMWTLAAEICEAEALNSTGESTRYYSMKMPAKASWPTTVAQVDIWMYVVRGTSGGSSTWEIRVQNITEGDNDRIEVNGGSATTGTMWQWGTLELDDSVEYNDFSIEVYDSTGLAGGTTDYIANVAFIPAFVFSGALPANDGGYSNGVTPILTALLVAFQFVHSIVLRLASTMAIDLYERRVGPIITSGRRIDWTYDETKDDFHLKFRFRQRVPAGVTSATFRVRTSVSTVRVRVEAHAGSRVANVETASLSALAFHSFTISDLPVADWGADLEWFIYLADGALLGLSGWFDDAVY